MRFVSVIISQLSCYGIKVKWIWHKFGGVLRNIVPLSFGHVVIEPSGWKYILFSQGRVCELRELWCYKSLANIYCRFGLACYCCASALCFSKCFQCVKPSLPGDWWYGNSFIILKCSSATLLKHLVNIRIICAMSWLW